MKLVLLIFGIIATITFVSSQLSIYGTDTERVINLLPPEDPTFQNNTGSVNNSACWGGNCNSSSFVLRTGDTMTGTLYSSALDWIVGLVGSTQVFRCGTSLFGVVSCTTTNNLDFYLGSDDANQRMVFADTTAGVTPGQMGFVANQILGFYVGDLLIETERFRINRTAIITYQDTDINSYKLRNVGSLNFIPSGSSNDGIYLTSINNLTITTGNIPRFSVNNFSTIFYNNISLNSEATKLLGNGTISLVPEKGQAQEFRIGRTSSTASLTIIGADTLTLADNFRFTGAGGKNLTNIGTGNATDFIVYRNFEVANITISNTSMFINGSGQFQEIFSNPFNGTGVYASRKPVIPHQTYFPALDLDTLYNNTLDRPIRIDLTFYSDVKGSGDKAFVELKKGVNLVNQVVSSEGVLNNEFVSAVVSTQELHHLSGTIQPAERYIFSTNVSGSGGINTAGESLIVQVTIL